MSDKSQKAAAGIYSQLMELDNEDRSSEPVKGGANGTTVQRDNATTGQPDKGQTPEDTAEDNNADKPRQPKLPVAYHTERTAQRPTIRASFDVYLDQVDKIHQLWIRFQAVGIKISKTDIVRDAIDEYLKQFESTDAEEKLHG